MISKIVYFSCSYYFSRSGDIVEPLLKPQWYVRCDSMARQAVKVVDMGDLKITPEMWVKTWNHWLNDIRYEVYLRLGEAEVTSSPVSIKRAQIRTPNNP